MGIARGGRGVQLSYSWRVIFIREVLKKWKKIKNKTKNDLLAMKQILYDEIWILKSMRLAYKAPEALYKQTLIRHGLAWLIQDRVWGGTIMCLVSVHYYCDKVILIWFKEYCDLYQYFNKMVTFALPNLMYRQFEIKVKFLQLLSPAEKGMKMQANEYTNNF